ncbi:MAG: hypothetical protein ACP5E4_00695 [Candidatus Aenigmatarchaeota archaeon]
MEKSNLSYVSYGPYIVEETLNNLNLAISAEAHPARPDSDSLGLYDRLTAEDAYLVLKLFETAGPLYCTNNAFSLVLGLTDDRLTLYEPSYGLKDVKTSLKGTIVASHPRYSGISGDKDEPEKKRGILKNTLPPPYPRKKKMFEGLGRLQVGDQHQCAIYSAYAGWIADQASSRNPKSPLELLKYLQSYSVLKSDGI